MTIDVAKLRKMTADAKTAKAKIAQAKADEAERQRLETLAEHKRIADNIIAKIPTMCEKRHLRARIKLKSCSWLMTEIT